MLMTEYDYSYWPFALFFMAMFFLPFIGAITATYVWHRRTGKGLHDMMHDMHAMKGPWSMMGFWQGKQDIEPTGNAAFDAYRQETLDRLEEELQAFLAFRDRLREASDRESFDKFMKDMEAAKS